MKKLLASLGLAAGLVLGATGIVSADPIDDNTPACTIYVSYQTVPLSAQCQPYYVNGMLVFNALSVNEGK